jgi:hypothetical protein
VRIPLDYSPTRRVPGSDELLCGEHYDGMGSGGHNGFVVQTGNRDGPVKPCTLVICYALNKYRCDYNMNNCLNTSTLSHHRASDRKTVGGNGIYALVPIHILKNSFHRHQRTVVTLWRSIEVGLLLRMPVYHNMV